ncbi:MAG: hypothetical protein R2940_05460 [Syntrophotaleaceae bacterium]
MSRKRDRQTARNKAQVQKQRQRGKGDSPAPLSAAAAAGPLGSGQPAGSRQLPLNNLDRKITVRLDADRYRQLDEYARREGFTVSVIVRHLLCRFLEDLRRNPGGRGL